jgi:hypothetical protein
MLGPATLRLDLITPARQLPMRHWLVEALFVGGRIKAEPNTMKSRNNPNDVRRQGQAEEPAFWKRLAVNGAAC